MPTRILLSVDTELRWGPYLSGGSWEENYRLSFDPAGVGIPYQLDLLRRHGLKACFFVDPMPALLYGPEPIRRMVDTILEAGQEVQLHVHCGWAGVARGTPAQFELTAFNADEQEALIAEALDLLVAAGASRPIAFRAGSFAANADTLVALRRLGIAFDSSHNGAAHPWPSQLPLAPELIDPADVAGVREIPITQIQLGNGKLRPLQLCAVSTDEMQAALRHASRNDHPVVTIVSHSFELATRDGRRINGLVHGRFLQLCEFLAENRESMPTVTFAELEGVAASKPSSPLNAAWHGTAARIAQQAWGTALYEKPFLAIIAAAGSAAIIAYAATAAF